MTSPRVDGAYPRRTDTSSTTGSSPRIGADAQARSKQLAQQFAAQVQLSMLQSLTQLSAGGEPDESGEGGDSGGDAGIGIDSGMQQMLLMTSLFAGASEGGGKSAAQFQAQLSALGLGGLGGGGSDPFAALAGGAGGPIAGAGADSEAALAQQLLGSLSGASGASSATTVAGAPATDRGAAANAKVVADVARQQGVDPTVAVAMMLVESGGRNTAVGDGGTSFGLFQLHEGGMLTAAGLTAQQAFDPRTNATVALKSYKHEWSKGHDTRSPGQIAAASQRPADPVGYAAKVDAAMARARSLLGGA